MNVRTLRQQSNHFDARALHESVVKLDLHAVNLTNLEQLWDASSPLRTLIPELSLYAITTVDGRAEFPRTMAALASMGTMMRAAHALALLDRPVLGVKERMKASTVLREEYTNFTIHPNNKLGMTFDQFQRFARLFEPLNCNHSVLTLAALEVVYGDLGKLSSIRKALTTKLGIDTSDHDAALLTAFEHPLFHTVANYFPTVGTISQEIYGNLHANLTRGFNIGGMLQIEVPAAVAKPLSEVAITNQDGVTAWFLASLADIFGARAEASDPVSWHTSRLVTGTLAEDLLEVAQHLDKLSPEDNGLGFFNSLHESLYARPYYQPIRDAHHLSHDEKRSVYRLSRFLSFQTDSRPIEALINHWREMSQTERHLFTSFLDNAGLDAETPRPIITYIPYLFNRLYVRHFPLNEALGRFSSDMTDLLQQLAATGDEARWARAEGGAGYYTVSCQDTWRHSLQGMRREEIEKRNPRLTVIRNEKDNPEVVVKDEMLLRSDLARARLLSALQGATKEAEDMCKAMLLPNLNVTERELLGWVSFLPFVDGSWYRPIHNLIVPMAMVKICQESGAPRFLVVPAIVHDVGYSAFEVPGTLQGAGWTSKPMREGHQLASKEMSAPVITRLREEEKLRIADEIYEHILEIIATHDNPYIGIPLTDPLAKLHRDADRSFVISCVSFWKDYLAYLSDPKRMEYFAAHGVQVTPETFLKVREASFQEIPTSPVDEHTVVEPMTSPTAQRLFDVQRVLRREEIAPVLELLCRDDDVSCAALKEFLRSRIVAEFTAIMRKH